jgi:hypothetical protein
LRFAVRDNNHPVPLHNLSITKMQSLFKPTYGGKWPQVSGNF